MTRLMRTNHVVWNGLVSATVATVMILFTTAPTALGQRDREADAKPEATIGKPAPEFTLTDIDGKEHKLSDYKGKIVVLEWFNAECPFVDKQHRDGPLKDQGNKAHKKENVVWLAVVTGQPGAQGTGVEKNRRFREQFKIEYPIVLDEDTSVGRLYGATNTPHMYVIDAKGVLRYRGAIDNAPMGVVKASDGEFVNYVEEALDAIEAGETVAIAETRAYGCTVKYGGRRRR